MKFIVDTNIFLDHLDKLQGIEDFEMVILSHCIRELDKHKSNRADRELAFKARKATRFIDSQENRKYLDLKDYTWTVDDEHESTYVDNLIIQACIENDYGVVTKDTLLKLKAESYGIPYINVDEKTTNVDMYTGFVEVEAMDNREYDEILKEYIGGEGLITNQYLIIHFLGEQFAHRWTGTELIDISLPHYSILAPQNVYQACAIDLLWNMDVPIKIITGTYGSGKTYLSVKMGLNYIKDDAPKDKQFAKLMMVRNAVGAGSDDIGYLKGSKSDKTDPYFKPIVQHLERGEDDLQELESKGQIEKEIPYYMKGLSIANTFMIVDEAEDLDLKLIKLVGTRLSEGSAVVFSGDFNQAEDKFIHNNGLYAAIEQLKGNPLVGIVCLQEDIRSEASKVFATLL